MRILRSRTWRAALLTFGVLAVCGGAAIYRNWTAIERYAVYEFQTRRYKSDPDPLLRKLADGAIRPGDPIEPLIETYLTRYVDRHDEFVTVGFGPPGGGCSSVILAAKWGRIVSAVDRCSWPQHTFFNTLTPTEHAAYKANYAAFLAQEAESWRAAHHAVGGAAAVAFNHGCCERASGDRSSSGSR